MRHMLALSIVGVLLLGSTVRAHPGHDHAPDLRVWRDADGLFEIEASFVLARGDQVQLCKHDGTLVWVPLEKLSRNDRNWVQTRLEEIRRVNAAPGSELLDERSESSSDSEWSTSVPSEVLAGGAMVLLAVMGILFRRKRSAIPLAILFFALVGSTTVLAIDDKKAPPAIQKHFEPFKDQLELRSDDDYLYVGSNAFPDHPMMVGIRAWQQQVPLPQPYTGKNAWQIPLKPRLAEKPISAKNALYRGAIALAVNGVPIFNALNNRGEDAYRAGELDEYGGHCGRGDDYHYHIAPVHLEKVVGKGQPIAYALDGYPLYGYTDSDGKEPNDLDAFNGRMEKDGYRYYSTKTYPYINGGMRGVVTVRGDQIDPQPRDAPVRPAGEPLRGAKITAFIRDDDKQTYTLKYDRQGKTLSVMYIINKDGTYTFVSTDKNGKETTETYRRRERKDGPPQKDRPPPKKHSSPQAT